MFPNTGELKKVMAPKSDHSPIVLFTDVDCKSRALWVVEGKHRCKLVVVETLLVVGDSRRNKEVGETEMVVEEICSSRDEDREMVEEDSCSNKEGVEKVMEVEVTCSNRVVVVVVMEMVVVVTGNSKEVAVMDPVVEVICNSREVVVMEMVE
ncbi:unnamed protein product [Sphenostylis stenocarpa]|uniref:Uncharacterized protein n=1 Tax=Sphenostylis stenocarpa TaxID=92480 RepID=A0AA86RVD5_9FABA|nr:unnamed protein product [Sphenostylis stenocarpa]